MAAEQITQVISEFPPPPQSGVDDEVQFNLKSDAFVAHQATNYTPEVNEWADQANVVAVQVNANAISADEDAIAAGESAAAASDSALSISRPNKNVAVNGNFEVWQDPRTTGNKNTTGFGADLWWGSCRYTAGGQVEFVKDKMKDNRPALKFEVTQAISEGSAIDRWTGIYYNGEEADVHEWFGGDMAFSFDFESSRKGIFPFALTFYDDDRSGSSYVTTFEYNPANAGDTVSIEVTIPLPPLSSFTYPPSGNPLMGMGYEVNIAFCKTGGQYTAPAQDTWYFSDVWYATVSGTVDWALGVGDYIKMSKWQIEKDSVSTFEEVTYADALKGVQRYVYFIKMDAVNDYCYATVGSASSVNKAVFMIDFPVPMAYRPSFAISDWTHLWSSSGAITTATLDSFRGDEGGWDGCELYVVTENQVAGEAVLLELYDGGYIGFNARV